MLTDVVDCTSSLIMLSDGICQSLVDGQLIERQSHASGTLLTVSGVNVQAFDSSGFFVNAGELVASWADGSPDIDFGALQTGAFNHYLVAYQDTTGSKRTVDLNIQSENDFRNTGVFTDA